MKMTYDNITSYKAFDKLYGMDMGSMDIASLANRATAPTCLILSHLNPFLVENLISVSETPVDANSTHNQPSFCFLCIK